MKKYLLTILLPILASCTDSYNPIIVKTLWQCSNNTVVMSAHGNYAEVKAAKYELYSDANKNKRFDDVDKMIGYSVSMTLVHNDHYLSQPIKLSEQWTEGSLFAVVICGSDTAISEISGCSASISDFSNN